jgi:hypothetical protein
MTIKTLLLAGVLSIAAASAAFATDGPGGPTDGTSRSHASAAPACGDQCPVLATEGGPGGINDNNGRSGSGRMAGDGGPVGVGDDNGRSMASATGRSGQIPTLWRPVLAGDGGPTGAGDGNGRSSAALSKGGAEFLVASIRAGQGDF